MLLFKCLRGRYIVDSGSCGRGDGGRATGTDVEGKEWSGDLACANAACFLCCCVGSVEGWPCIGVDNRVTESVSVGDGLVESVWYW